jgi:hypothetical protein
MFKNLIKRLNKQREAHRKELSTYHGVNKGVLKVHHLMQYNKLMSIDGGQMAYVRTIGDRCNDFTHINKCSMNFKQRKKMKIGIIT